MNFKIIPMACLAMTAPLFGADATAQAVTATAAAPAATPVSAEGAEAINRELTTDVGPGKLLRDDMAAFAQELGIQYGVADAKGRVYFTGTSSVAEDLKKPSFIKSRAMAYERAYQDAVAKFIMDLVGRHMTKTVHESFEDGRDDPYTPPAGLNEAEKTIAGKVALLADAKLDKALADMGVSPDKYAGAKTAAKRTLFKDTLIKRSTKTAVAASSGCVPIQTFEGYTEKGRYAIGVVIRCDQDTKAIAYALKTKQRPVISRPTGLTVAQALPSEAEMIASFGVRLYFDETGMPSLLSFGQYGTSYTGNNERRAERALEHAFEQAEHLADSHLTTFISSSISAANQSDVGEEEYDGVAFKDDGSASDESYIAQIDRITKKSTVTGFDSMIGRSTVLRKELTHPSEGHKIALVVRRWSFSQLDAARAILNGPQPKAAVTPATNVKGEGNGVRRGRVYDF